MDYGLLNDASEISLDTAGKSVTLTWRFRSRAEALEFNDKLAEVLQCDMRAVGSYMLVH